LKKDLQIQIADLSIAGEGCKLSFLRLLRKRYFSFLSRSHPVLFLTLNFKKSRDYLQTPNVRIIKEKKNGCFLIQRGDDFVGVIDLETGKGHVNIVEDIYSFDSFLRVLFSLVLIKNQGFLLHSAGIVKDNSAYLFTGPSFSGKSTAVRLSNNFPILSDEIIAIRKIKNNFLAYSTPFWGFSKFNPGFVRSAQKKRFARIKGIFFLKKDRRTHLQRLILPQAFRRLLGNILFFSTDIFLIQTVMDLVNNFLETVPSYELSFLPDKSFWRELP